MRCHYEVLDISRDATVDDIKKAYRKKALVYHPDKNADNIQEAQKRFIEVQDAYETLSNDQERAWYDAHREVLINGGKPGESNEETYLFNVYPYFSTSCFKGYDDGEKGFYTIYRDVFNQIAKEDCDHYEEGTEIPQFGDSKSTYEDVVSKFYAFWSSYCTPRSFVWAEKHDTREASDRYIRRQMEKENKKLRDKAKKERNEEIRKLVEYVRKKDKRMEEYKKILEERAKLAQKKAEEKREADRQKRLEQMKNFVEQDWMRVRTHSEGSNESEVNDSEPNENDNENNDAEGDENEDNFFCVGCNKSFKSEKAFTNHEKSKKHKENIEFLKKQMNEEDLNYLVSKNGLNEVENEKEDDKPKQKLSKKQKKKNKLRKKAAEESSEEDDVKNDEVIREPVIVANTSEQEIVTNTSEQTCQEALKKEIPQNEKPSICSVCKVEFPSRNKLFDHIKEENHAAIKETHSKKSTKNQKSKKK